MIAFAYNVMEIKPMADEHITYCNGKTAERLKRFVNATTPPFGFEFLVMQFCNGRS